MSSLPTIAQPLPLRPLDYRPPAKETQTSLTPESYNPLPMTRRQKLFVEYYIADGMKSAERAALKAGYAPSTAAAASEQILHTPAVAREIKRRVRALYKELELTTEDIIRGYEIWAEANIQDYAVFDPENPNRVYFDLRNISRQQASAIQSISYDADGRLRVELVDKKAARDVLVKIKKIGDDSKHPLDSEGAPLTIAALDALIQKSNNITINNTTINVSGDGGGKRSPNVIDAEVVEQK